MLVNRDITWAASKYRSQGHLSTERKAYIDSLVESYEIACRLSVGGDEQRSAYWHGKAGEAREALCRAISYEADLKHEACCGR